MMYLIPFGINRVADRIRGFLESFEGEKDVTRGLADMDLRDEQDDRFRRLKYMKQLVCHQRTHYMIMHVDAIH